MADYLTFQVHEHFCAVPVGIVRDVVRGIPSLTRVHGAPPAVLGVFSLRGRVAAAVSLRARLGLPAAQTRGNKFPGVVVESKGELYCLAVDAVGGVLSCPELLPAPPHCEGAWAKAVAGVGTVEDRLLAVLDIPGMLEEMCRNNNEKEQPGRA